MVFKLLVVVVAAIIMIVFVGVIIMIIALIGGISIIIGNVELSVGLMLSVVLYGIVLYFFMDRYIRLSGKKGSIK